MFKGPIASSAPSPTHACLGESEGDALGVGVVIHHVFKQWMGGPGLYGVNDRPSLWAVPALGEDKTGGVGASGAQGSHHSHQSRLGSLGQCVWATGC